jgi:hypothetical protein
MRVNLQEYARRFGLKVQMEYTRRRRAGLSASGMQPAQNHAQTASRLGDYHQPFHSHSNSSREPEPSWTHRRATQNGSWRLPLAMSRENLTVLGIAVVMIAILVAAVLLPPSADRHRHDQHRHGRRHTKRGRLF